MGQGCMKGDAVEEKKKSEKKYVAPEKEKKTKKEVNAAPVVNEKKVEEIEEKKSPVEVSTPPPKPVPPPPTPPPPLPHGDEEAEMSPKSKMQFITKVEITHDEKGRRHINDYTVLRHLGSGRYGEVYLVDKDGADYAMKEVSKKLFKKSGESKEVSILTKIDHPNAVKLYAVMDDDTLKEQYLIFEYVDGGAIMTLTDKGVTREPPFPEETTREYFLQIVEGLQHLHDCNIIHRDIKPENILITKDRKCVKLADFGVSRAMASNDDGSRETGGTPMFLSPEACRGDFSSGKSNDIWALGITLYIFMFARTPFTSAKTEIALYNKIQNDQIIYPKRPSYSSELMALLKRMLERNVLLRITLNEIRNNSWVRGSSAPVPDVELSTLTKNPNENEVTPIHLRDERNTTDPDGMINILIVEDVFLTQKVTAKMFKSILDPETTTVKLVSDGEDAIDACKHCRFHIVLMDVHMSRVSGVAATNKILSYEAENNLLQTNIVGLTADPHEDIIKVCLEAGMRRVLQKPLQPSVLRGLLEEFGFPIENNDKKFDATADFQKGELRGGGQNNAYLKSYQEHLARSEKGEQPPQPPQNEPSSPKSSTSTGHELDKRVLQTNDTTSTDSSGRVISGSLSSDDMRNRSIQCMKTHQNMYKKKNCDKLFTYIDEEELPQLHCAMLQVLQDKAADWSVIAHITQDEYLELHELLNESEYWINELRALNSDVIPVDEMQEKVVQSPVWEKILDAATSRESEPLSPKKHQIFAFADKGQRGGMEDTYAVVAEPRCYLLGDDAKYDNEYLVGVFDGHGGKYAAEFCKSNLLGKIVGHPSWGGDVGGAMKQCFQDVNKMFFKKTDSADCDAGTTALVVNVRDDVMTVGNVGDCRIVIGGKRPANQLNNLHICKDESERAEVEARGGSVIFYYGSWRVNGVLLVSRTIGDYPCRDVVSCDPEIHTFKITPEDDFAVIASDGLWDVMTPEEVCEAVSSAIEEIDNPPEKNEDEEAEEEEEEEELTYASIPEALIGEALARETGDNVTCVIIFFKTGGKEA